MSVDLDTILNGPALQPPEGVTSNFDEPSHYNVSGYVLLSLFLALGTFAITIRLFTQIVRLKKVHLEDFLALAGYAFLVGYIANCLKVLESPGYYVHQYDIRVKDMSRILYLFYLCSNCYSHAIGCLKAAILLSWLRIFNPLGIHRGFGWACHALLWFNVLYYSISAIVINVECSPHARIWDKTIMEGYCIDSSMFYLSGTIVNLVSDVAIFLLPQRVIWGLQASKSKKLGVSFVFGLGFICIIIACFRVVTTVALAKQTDVTYQLAALSFWGSSETLLVLLVFCVPAFPKAFKCGDRSKGNASPRSEKPHSKSWKSSVRTWPRSVKTDTQQSVYTNIDEHSLEFLTTPEQSTVSAKISSGPPETRRYANVRDKRGIIRTAEFETRNTRRDDEERLKGDTWLRAHTNQV